MGFKLGSENRKMNYDTAKNRFDIDDASVPGTPVIRKKMPKGIMGEANNDGSIFLSDKVVPGSEEERGILMHEMKHMVDMKTGKLSYDDDNISWMGEKYERKDGKINYNGKWHQEGDYTLPWEKH